MMGMRRVVRPTPEEIQRVVASYMDERQAEILLSGQAAKDGRSFSWCGEVLDFLVEGIGDRLATYGVTLSTPFPGPFRLWDEEHRPDGGHVRHFWTTVLANGCPIARLCTFFYHRHDQVQLPVPPQVVAYPIDAPTPRQKER